jgi:hypothetical protein
MLSKLVNWSGYASILGGLLFAVAVVLHPLRDGLSIFNSGAAYGAIHNLGVFGLMLQLFGLVGLYIREAETGAAQPDQLRRGLLWPGLLHLFAGRRRIAQSGAGPIRA